MQNTRILSLDILRGMTVAGMILVNNVGACGKPFAILRHASWDGFTPADLVFPMFLFLMGISTYISQRKFQFDRQKSWKKILKRSVSLIVIGVVMEYIVQSLQQGSCIEWEYLRLMGVMQRLGLCYGIVALLSTVIPHRKFLGCSMLMLGVYMILQWTGDGFDKTAENVIGRVDRLILGANHIYLQGHQFVDPEGILSSLPAVAQTMLGFECGRLLFQEPDHKERIRKLLIVGSVLLIGGYLLSYGCPVNKRLWSPSFVCITSGISMILLSLLMNVVEHKEPHVGFRPFVVLGVNPLAIYLFSYVTGDLFRIWRIPQFVYQHIFPFMGDYAVSLTYGVLFLLFNAALGYCLYKKHIYIKL